MPSGALAEARARQTPKRELGPSICATWSAQLSAQISQYVIVACR
jgi:hypothetical protein